jgi:hypothetical protein
MVAGQSRNQPVIRHAAFALLWLFVASVSVHDGYRALWSRHVLEHLERNPLGLWLIQLGGGDVVLLLLAKAAGTVIACAVLLWIYSRKPVLGLWLCGVLALVQLTLLLYLEAS